MDGGVCYLSGFVRRFLEVAFHDTVQIQPIPTESLGWLTQVSIGIVTPSTVNPVDLPGLVSYCKECLGETIITSGSRFTFKYLSGTTYVCEFLNLQTLKSDHVKMGLSTHLTGITMFCGSKQIGDDSRASVSLFKSGFNLFEQGIGGLSKEFEQMFRRVFATRVLDERRVEEMDVHHVKGIVMYGPPGCGKTLIARKIGEMLNAKTVTVVKASELLNKYVGESEANTRKLFAEAMTDTDPHSIHLIILDEMDAICKSRSADDHTGATSGVVNTLLAHIDGVTQLNNILLIGMTNRIDLIDSALLRPGRFEVQIEISLPTESDRLEILNIHTRQMAKNGYLASSVDLGVIAKLTPNFTGAETEGVVKSARSFAIARTIDATRMISGDKPILTQEDFVRGIHDIKPMFAEISDEISKYTSKQLVYWSDFKRIQMAVVGHIHELTRGHILRILVCGKTSVGKTSLVCDVVKQIVPSCARMIQPKMLSSTNVSYSCQVIHQCFEAVNKVPDGIMIVDAFEKLIEWCPIGSRLNNQILQKLSVEMSPFIPSTHTLTIMVTCNDISLIHELGLSELFDHTYVIPNEIQDSDQSLFHLSPLEDLSLTVSSAIKHLTM